jgi:hypothetical protein
MTATVKMSNRAVKTGAMSAQESGHAGLSAQTGEAAEFRPSCCTRRYPYSLVQFEPRPAAVLRWLQLTPASYKAFLIFTQR